MSLFKKKEPQTVKVKGKQLACPICSNNLFWIKNTFVLKTFGRGGTKCIVCSDALISFGFGVR